MRILTRLFLLIAIASPVVVSSQSGSIPTPASVLGFEPGADFKEATYDQVVSYFQKVDAASDRMTMMQAGRTSQGRPFHFALISSKENLSKIDRYREIARRLAHPEGLTDDEARKLAREGKAFVHIDGGLHATEIAGPQSTPLLLYDLLTRKDATTDAIFDNVIFMLWPTINPDGMQMVTEWFMSHVDPANPAAGASGLPQLYQEYVGHDNNRDAYMLNMIESRVMEYTWRTWEPNIIYVLHQAPPNPYRIWLPPFAEPIATHAPPIPSAQINMIGMAIAQGLSERRMPGAVHMLSTYDAWYPGYIDYAGVFKNVPSFWTETAGASPLPSNVNASENQRLPKALYVDPFPGGQWHFRNAVEYDEAAAMSVLEYAAKYRESLLYGRYQSGRDQIARGRTQAPYAYVIPQDQPDPVAPVELLRRLAFSGVRVSKLKAPAGIDGTIYPPGTWVIPADQEFTALAREVLDVQKYPVVIGSDGDPDPPYDAAGWTLPMQMGVTVTAVTKPLSDETRAKLELIGGMPEPKIKPAPYNMTTAADAAAFDSAPAIGFDASPSAAGIVPPAGKIAGAGPSLALSPAQNNTFKALNRVWKAGLDVQFMTAEPGGGRYIVNGLSEKDQDDLVKSFALSAERVNASAEPVKKPRIGLLSAPNSMDEGWTRWVLDMYGFSYLRVTPEEIAAGALRDKIDVLLVANDSQVGGGRGGGGGGRGAGGGRGGAAPTPAPAGAETVDPRVKAVDDFVKGGGTLVCFGRASTTTIDALKLPVKNAVAGLRATEFSAGGGGSVLQVTTDASHRVMSGMPEKAAVFYSDGPAFDTMPGFEGTVLAHYAETGSPLLSGYLLGEKYLQGKAAALDVQLGNGHVVLIGFRPQWRGQPFGTFRIIFNALLYTH